MVVELRLGSLDALAHSNEELVDVGLEKLGGFGVEGVWHFVLLHVDKRQSYLLDDGKDEMLTAVVPVLPDVFSQVQLPRRGLHHRVVGLAQEGHFGGLSGELFESDPELEFGVFVEAVPHEEQAVPYWVGEVVLWRVSSWGMT